ncbi:MAG: septum formation initiator family protein [Acidimicrobiia bacterium]|nr:septum formation initiator family protein [Acidimicrobiia bacterium]
MTTLAPPPTERRRPRQHRRSPWVAVLLLAALAITLAGIFPFRQMLAQQRQVDATEARLAELVEQNELLEDQVTALNSPAEIERLARERGLVLPGEKGFALEFEDDVEPQVATTVAPLVDRQDRSLLGQIWDFLTGRDLDPDD